VAIGDSEVGLLVFASLASNSFTIKDRYYLVLVSLLAHGQETTHVPRVNVVLKRESSDGVRTVHNIHVGLSLLVDGRLTRLILVRVLPDLRHANQCEVAHTHQFRSSGDRYDVTLEDEISGSVVVYWDVILLFLRTSEMVRDYIVRERN
jgi:hypothetical protein